MKAIQLFKTKREAQAEAATFWGWNIKIVPVDCYGPRGLLKKKVYAIKCNDNKYYRTTGEVA